MCAFFFSLSATFFNLLAETSKDLQRVALSSRTASPAMPAMLVQLRFPNGIAAARDGCSRFPGNVLLCRNGAFCSLTNTGKEMMKKHRFMAEG
ncbi:hypothetical protein [Massilia putida]|uniref:hypothetical protein n=1 Tax=Massilia putida TaxID=1141883 RepID=UPI0012EBABE7|nr:hypothetical protein [Massilia putida]